MHSSRTGLVRACCVSRTTRYCSTPVVSKGLVIKKEWGEEVMKYATLGKVKLTGLVAFTCSVGFAAAGGPVVSAAHLAVTGGCFLQSMSANTFNQVAERDFDKLMKRTDRRPMVKGTVTPSQAHTVATIQLATGTAMLYFVDPTAAVLGVTCWALYVHGYTPMKRMHWLNTWLGAIVGALPPMMGTVAAGAGILSPITLFLGGFLYFWQIPHFMSLCYLNRRDYKAAGFQMLSSLDTKRAGMFSIKYAIYTTAVATALPLYYGLASPFFVAESLAGGVYFTYASWLFYNEPLKHARKLFLISIAYLPIVLVLLLVHSPNLDLGISPKLLCPMATSA